MGRWVNPCFVKNKCRRVYCRHARARKQGWRCSHCKDAFQLDIYWTIGDLDDQNMFWCCSQSLTEALAEKLNQSSTDLVIANFDRKLDIICQQKSDPAWKVSSADYFVVHWTLARGADKSALTQCQYAADCHVDNNQLLIFLEYTSLTTSSCGNGRR